MPKIVELREDRKLIQNNFEGYKLSLDPVPLFKQELSSSPLVMERYENEQYSFLHVQLFAMNNFMQFDPYARNVTFFINNNYNIVRSFYDEAKIRPEKPLNIVYTFRKPAKRVKGDYNYSMRFISEKYCVVCDGICELFLFDTGDRLKATEWKLITNASIITEERERNFTIYDSRLDIVQEQKQISLALGRVQRIDNGNSLSHHEMHIHWMKWNLKDSKWNLSVLETLIGRGMIYYCAFEPRSDSLVISSNRPFNFKRLLTTLSIEQTSPRDNMITDDFTWSQTIDDLSITFNAKLNKTKSDYNIKCLSNSIQVKCGDETILDCCLFSNVNQKLTTWSMESNFLKINLVKQIPLSWPSLKINGDPKENTGQSITNLIAQQEPIANLEAPIEDCDLPLNTIEDEIKIERFNLPTCSITHTCFLSTPPLFTSTLRPGYPPAIATRLDVDACLFLQNYNPSKDEWTLRHEGNINAFGYVQASKQDKKFIDCAPDLNYAIICEPFRNIFLYRSNYNVSNGLRNRHGPQVHIGKQQLITLDDAGEVLGIATACNVVTLLTDKYILYMKINER